MVNIQKHLRSYFLALLIVLPIHLTYGLDMGDIFKNVIKSNGDQVGDIIGTLKSVVNPTFGNVLDGVKLPSESDGKVVLYTTQTCGYCRQAMAHVRANNIPYIEKDLTRNNDNQQEAGKLGWKNGVPFIVFGRETMHGFSKESFDYKYAKFKPNLQNQSATPQPRDAESVTTSSSQSVANHEVKPGDILEAKIAGITIYRTPSKASEKLLKLTKHAQVIYMGDEQNGYYHVTTESGDGWVDRLLVTNAKIQK